MSSSILIISKKSVKIDNVIIKSHFLAIFRKTTSYSIQELETTIMTAKIAYHNSTSQSRSIIRNDEFDDVCNETRKRIDSRIQDGIDKLLTGRYEFYVCL
jgi:hypothetical protein